MAHLPSPKRVEARQPRLKLHNEATLASGDEFAMNLVSFRALFLVAFREFLFPALR
jgi:hypothetical protein